MTQYLSLEQVVTINAAMVRQFGGIHGVRDLPALEAAVARPQLGYYTDILEEAAAFLESLLQNHPFLDGNKRTGVAATAVFLSLNGYKLFFEDIEAYDWLMGLFQTGQMRKANLESWLRQHSRKT